MIKEPGWSWIKVKDQLSVFVAGDQSHSQCEDIQSVLASTTDCTDELKISVDLEQIKVANELFVKELQIANNE